MLLIFAAAVTAVQVQPGHQGVTANARATIRIVSATRLRMGASSSEEGKPVERSTIQAADGTRQPAMLVQFQ